MSSSDVDDPSYLPPQSAQPRSTIVPDDADELFSSDVFSVASPVIGDIPHEHADEPYNPGNYFQSSFQDDRDLPVDSAEQDSKSPSLEPPRPNKFHGPPSTWRSLTATDRAIANSLDQIKAADLGIHLYNAHALKKRQRLLKAARNDEDAELEYDTWEPPKQWTAWPMMAAEVPRGQIRSFDEPTKDEYVWRSLEQQKGSTQDLKGALTAIFLKEAKERFLRRESEDEGTGSDASMNNTKSGRSRSKSQHSNHDTLCQVSKTMKPAVLADDEKAESILEPTIRHILTNVDNLLMGLHHARQAYLPTLDESQGKTQTDADGETSPLKTKPPRKKGKPARGRSPKSLNSQASSRISSRPPPQKPRSALSSTSRTRSRSRRRRELGLRDWSDILSLASMTGWPDSTIRRTAKRCADLFGEGIEFRTLREGSESMRETIYLPSLIPEDQDETAPSSENSESSLSDDPSSVRIRPLSAKIVNGTFYCPLTDCPRSERGFARNWNFQKHVREKHGDLVPAVESEDEMVGAVHVDGFLKPVKARKGWRGRKGAVGTKGGGGEGLKE